MTKKLTQEEVSKLYAEQGYELISEYKGNGKMLFVKDKEGYICTSCLSTFKNGSTPKKFCTNNPYTIQNIKLYVSQFEYELLSTQYNGNREKLLLKCPKGHQYNATWNDFKQGCRCSKCSHNEISEETVIYNSSPWMMDLGVNKEDAKKYLPQSNQKITVTCPNCGKTKKIQISQIYQTKSIGCSCGDGISYNEKFIISLLDQLEIEYIKEYKPKWSNNKRYDFYFEYNNKFVIIECHGEQHYEEQKRGRTLKEEQDNDKLKEQLAYKNGINNYIILDCRISELKQIKNSILNSELSEIFNLNNIDWLKCEEFAINFNKVKEVCDYWNNKNEEDTIINISKKLNLSRDMIKRYLKKGDTLGWCNYNGKEEMKKNGSKNGKLSGKKVEIFKDEKSLGVFPSTLELSRQSEELFGVKLSSSRIGCACRGEIKQYKGYTFKYVEE